MKKHSMMFDKIGYRGQSEYRVYRGIRIPLERIIALLGDGATIVPRKIASWTHDCEVAIRALDYRIHKFDDRCAGVIIHRRIPSKHVVWDSNDRYLIDYVKQHLIKSSKQQMVKKDRLRLLLRDVLHGNIAIEEEVVVAKLPRYRLTRENVAQIRIDQQYVDELRQAFDLEIKPGMRFGYHIILNKQDIKNIRVY